MVLAGVQLLHTSLSENAPAYTDDLLFCNLFRFVQNTFYENN